MPELRCLGPHGQTSQRSWVWGLSILGLGSRFQVWGLKPNSSSKFQVCLGLSLGV